MLTKKFAFYFLLSIAVHGVLVFGVLRPQERNSTLLKKSSQKILSNPQESAVYQKITVNVPQNSENKQINNDSSFADQKRKKQAPPTQKKALELPKNERTTLSLKAKDRTARDNAAPRKTDANSKLASGLGNQQTYQVGSSEAILIKDTLTLNYTDEAKEAMLEGDFFFEVLVNAEGLAEKVHLKNLIGFQMDEIAKKAILDARFHPARNESGVPVRKWTILQISLVLED